MLGGSIEEVSHPLQIHYGPWKSMKRRSFEQGTTLVIQVRPFLIFSGDSVVRIVPVSIVAYTDTSAR
jgi:hypothetical protein